MPVKKGLVEENVSTKVLAALSTAFGREISFVDDLTYAEYETELREAMLKVHPDRGGDEETFKILSAERERIRKRNSEIVPKEKKTTIKGVKLLPGTTFRPDDIKPADVDKDSSGSSTVNIADRLNNIADALGVIGGLFKLELKALQDKETQDLKDKAEQDKKAREAELEQKKAVTKPKKDSKLKIPKLGFFETLKKFFLNVALGAGALKLLEWLKNPENKEKIEKFTNWLTNNADSIFKWILKIVAIDVGVKILNLIGAGGVIWAVLKRLGMLKITIGTMLFMLPSLFGKPGDRSHFENKAIRLLNNQYDGNKSALLRDLEAARSGDRRDLHKRFGLQSGPLGGRETVIDDMIKAVEEFKIGGRPPVGEVVSVGEQGRELFVADRPGTIISNDKTENVFNDGALLVTKSNTLNKISNTASSISQRVDKKRTPNLIDLRGGKGSTSNPTFNTGDQISSVPSEDTSNIDIFTGSLSYGLVG